MDHADDDARASDAGTEGMADLDDPALREALRTLAPTIDMASGRMIHERHVRRSQRRSIAMKAIASVAVLGIGVGAWPHGQTRRQV